MLDWRLALPALLLLGGCLPHSCSRTGSRALAPVDSLSREVARATPIDTLRRVWRTEASDDVPLRFPRTVMFLPGNRSATDGSGAQIAVSDAEWDALLFFSEDGRLVRTVAPESTFTAPYLIGRRADTLLVLSPRERRVHFVADGAVARTVTLALPPVEEAPLLWATATDTALFAKTIDADGQAAVTRHGTGGRVTARRALAGPRWHHAGPLRLWRGALASLSGFRPVVHRLPPALSSGAGAGEAVRLTGFDSPMLARTRQYVEGDTRQPPLLLPDAATAGSGDGDLLFALNLRAGRLRIDVFGPDGRLVRRLVAPGPARRRDVFPRALAVRRAEGGGYTLVVALTAPRPAIARYRWQPTGGTPLARR